MDKETSKGDVRRIMSEADKMFEELGYEKHIRNLNHEPIEIDYIRPNKKYSTNIKFCLRSKLILPYIDTDEDLSGYIGVVELKAINKKVEELGWNE